MYPDFEKYHIRTMIFFKLTIVLIFGLVEFPQQLTCGPCESDSSGDLQFDSITCTRHNQLLITSGNQLYRGQCNNYPFTVDPEAQLLIQREALIRASFVDHQDTMYFLEAEKVIIMKNGKQSELPVAQVFEGFRGQVTYAIVIPNPKNNLKEVVAPYMVQIYSNIKGRFYNYNKKQSKSLHPYWINTIDWSPPAQIIYDLALESNNMTSNETIPLKVRNLISVDGQKIMSLVTDSKSNLVYSEARLPICALHFIYYYNLIDCIERNPSNQELRSGPIVICSHKSYGLNILSIMLWSTAGLGVFAMLAVIKCIIVGICKKTRKTKRKVRFSEIVESEPKIRVFSGESANHEVDNRLLYEADSMARSADSINDDYKDISLSIDLKEDNFSKQSNHH